MKRKLMYTLVAGCAGLVLAVGIHAQTPSPSPTPGGAGEHKWGLLGRLTHALGLSDTQQAAAATVIGNAQPQIEQIKQQAKQQIDGVLNNVVTQLDPSLTGSQQSQLAAIVQKIESRPGLGDGGGFHGHGRFGGRGGPGGGRGGFGGGPGGAGMLEHLTKALQLTDAQVAQIQPILDSSHTQAQAIFQNQNLTQQQKFAQVTGIMQVTNGQINSLLNGQQQQEFAALKDRGGRGRRGHFHGPGGGDQPSPTATPETSGS